MQRNPFRLLLLLLLLLTMMVSWWIFVDRYKWNSVQNMHLIIFGLYYALTRLHESKKIANITTDIGSRERIKNNCTNRAHTPSWNIYGDDLMSSNWQRPTKFCVQLRIKPNGAKKKINNLTKILVTKKKKSDQWNFSSDGKKSPTKRNIWNYCRKMNLENQQKCHRTHSFQQFFLCSSLGIFFCANC